MTQKLRVYEDFYMMIKVNIPKPTSEGSQMPLSPVPAPRDLMHLLVPANIMHTHTHGGVGGVESGWKQQLLQMLPSTELELASISGSVKSGSVTLRDSRTEFPLFYDTEVLFLGIFLKDVKIFLNIFCKMSQNLWKIRLSPKITKS